MNGQILLRKSIYYATDDSTGTTTNWANGVTFVKTYEKYNRLIKVVFVAQYVVQICVVGANLLTRRNFRAKITFISV